MATIEQTFDIPAPCQNKCPDCGKRNGPEPHIHTCTPAAARDIKLTLHVSIAPEVQRLLDQLEIPSPATLNALDADDSQK